MSMIKKSISLTKTQDAWIKAQLSSGNYGNESEVLRELIRERQQREQEQGNKSLIESLRAELIKAEQSGFTSQTVADIWAEARQGRSSDV